MKRFFTQEERYLMMDHNVPEAVAKARIKSNWDRQVAMTKPIHKRKAPAKELEIIINQLKNVLIFYADKQNYDWDTNEDFGEYVHRVDFDQGTLARKVLDELRAT